jgi:ferredoxin
MKIDVNLGLCQGHGQCEDSAPEVFVVGDDALAHLVDETPPESLRPAVEEAARRCPVEAILVGER